MAGQHDHSAAAVRRGLAALGRALPGPMGAFARLHHAAMADGALPTSTKELIALAMAIGEGCSGCIAYHAERAVAAGATREQAVEAVGVAVAMAGGPGAVHAADALAALDERFSAA